MKNSRRSFIKTGILSGFGFAAGGMLTSDLTNYGTNAAFAGKYFSNNSEKSVSNMKSVHKVTRLNNPLKIDGNWDKAQWSNVEVISISNFMGEKPGYLPVAEAKMMYDKNNLYLIYRVKDRFVRCLTNEINGPVWEDACVEFFFSPDTKMPLKYFNLEMNCGGTPLMRYNLVPRKEFKFLEVSDIKKIEISHQLPELIDPEIVDPVTWTIEYKIPLSMLEKYAELTKPKPGVKWRANFYKVAENSSNPHYMTWSVVDNPVPDFHLPQFFGELEFI